MRRVQAQGRDGAVQFLLHRVADGVYVERVEERRRGLHTVQSMIFGDAESFTRWCDGDPVRFDHPVLHVNLKRCGDELLRPPG